MKFEIPAGARYILGALGDAGYEAWLVGGCVRDLLRGAAPHDWDICTSALPHETEACFSGHKIIETGLKHGTVTILAGGDPFEVTTYRSDGRYTDGRRPDSVRFVRELEKDLARRDFTINAIALGLDGALRDPFGGQGDLRAGLIRCVGDPDRRFQEDALRLMRALRFAAVLGYDIEEGTALAIHRSRALLGRVASERISAELGKLLCGPGAGSVLRRFPDVLCQFWPELAPLLTLEQNNPWHCWGGWEHTLHALDAAPAETVLRLTMLLHDIGKPAVKTTDENGVDHFHGHPAVGAQLAGRMLRRLRFDNDTVERVVRLVKHHDAPLEPQARAIRRLLHTLGPEDFYRLVEVRRADSMAQAPEKAGARLAGLDRVRAMADEILAEGQCFSLRELAVNGRDVIAAGVPAGAQVGQVLNALLEQVINGELPNDRPALLQAIQAAMEA